MEWAGCKGSYLFTQSRRLQFLDQESHPHFELGSFMADRASGRKRREMLAIVYKTSKKERNVHNERCWEGREKKKKKGR
jgi:hypothetical protein